MVPVAQIAHAMPQRLRLKVSSRRGDDSYFARLTEKLESSFTSCRVHTNMLTGSILVCGDDVDIEAISDFGRSQALFRVETSEPVPLPVVTSIISPLQSLDRNVKAATGGRLDLPGTVFITLLFAGIIEIIRGNWKSPPWYTAFWYAFGLYTKTLLDQAADTVEVHPGDG